VQIIRVRAVIVAIRLLGQIIVIIIEAGTTMPLIPRPATTKILYTVLILSSCAAAKALQPAVIITEDPDYKLTIPATEDRE
jgi:hypothetical protein